MSPLGLVAALGVRGSREEEFLGVRVVLEVGAQRAPLADLAPRNGAWSPKRLYIFGISVEF